jgi:hypothetical protein
LKTEDGKGNENHELGTGFFVHKENHIGRYEGRVVSDKMSYTILTGRWCDVIVLNVDAPKEDKTNDMKDRFYEKLQHVFDKFLKYHMKMLLRDFNAEQFGKRVYTKLVEIIELEQ